MDIKTYSETPKNINALIENNMGLVRKIAWHMHGRVKSAVEIEDLIQIGMYGLVTAAQNYVVKEGVSFASYAGIRIRGEIVDHLRRNSNLCRTTIQMQQKYNASFEKLSRQFQREPKNNEIAKDMGLEASELDNWEQAFAANTHQSLDSVYDEFSIWFASNDQSPEDELSDTELRENLVEALKTLPEREAMLVQLYYVEELNVYEIAEVLEITTGRVSQIKKSAISRLREFIQKID
ncbi:MAG: DNA-directed RNA polymerase sigma-70 factor [Alphaproteobacteria bacterium]|nr:MAG: DNA-directed RNA polymerase sigma-70 factor [Alphaproteobacteria bacterium]